MAALVAGAPGEGRPGRPPVHWHRRLRTLGLAELSGWHGGAHGHRLYAAAAAMGPARARGIDPGPGPAESRPASGPGHHRERSLAPGRVRRLEPDGIRPRPRTAWPRCVDSAFDRHRRGGGAWLAAPGDRDRCARAGRPVLV